MSQPSTNIFSLEQARQTLPLIRPIVNDVISCHETVTNRLNEHFTASDHDPETSSSDQKGTRLSGNDLSKFRKNLKEYVNELYQIGAELHDFNVGRVDFPSRLHHRVVYLCWEHGEDDIRHWHEVYEPCHKRQKIDGEEFDHL